MSTVFGRMSGGRHSECRPSQASAYPTDQPRKKEKGEESATKNDKRGSFLRKFPKQVGIFSIPKSNDFSPKRIVKGFDSPGWLDMEERQIDRSTGAAAAADRWDEISNR